MCQCKCKHVAKGRHSVADRMKEDCYSVNYTAIRAEFTKNGYRMVTFEMESKSEREVTLKNMRECQGIFYIVKPIHRDNSLAICK